MVRDIVAGAAIAVFVLWASVDCSDIEKTLLGGNDFEKVNWTHDTGRSLSPVRFLVVFIRVNMHCGYSDMPISRQIQGDMTK